MKIFVSVGNTHYNNLIKAIDEQLSPSEFEVTIQLADGNFLPKNHRYFRLTDNISKYFDDADIIIAHAGAGTVFQLLEENKKVVVVPNNERLDDHQLDLAQYVEENQFACVCYDLCNIRTSIVEASSINYQSYIVEPFVGYDYIDRLFFDELHTTKHSNNVGTLPLNIYRTMDDAVNQIITNAGEVIAGSAIAINPEKVIRSIQDPTIHDAIMEATIRYADGIGVVKTLARKSGQYVTRIPGCELWEKVMEKSGVFNLPVYLVGATENVINETKLQLKEQYSVNVCGTQNGYFSKDNETDIIECISKLQPKIVTVALGSPRQELFIQQCRKLCPDTFFMGVGGTYDVYTNKVKRAPLFYRKLNLEWFYRLISEPKRLFRQTNLVKYLYLELTRKL